MRKNEIRWNGCLVWIILVCVMFSIFSEEAQAIPAFARKYKTSCATCHEIYPRLNAVGEAFRLNGFKFSDDELYIKDEPVELGDEAYKRLWPKAIWPSDIPGLPPISLTLNNDFTYGKGGREQSRGEFKTPSIAKILGAGAFGESISAFIELSFERQGAGGAAHHGGASTSEGTNTDVAGWIQFEDLFGIENLFNFRVGTVGMHEMGLFTHRNHNRISITNYFYGITMPTLTNHNIEAAIAGITDHDDISYTGNGYNLHAQPGIEINGFSKRWRYAVGLVNGNGNKFNDSNRQKDMYFQVAHKIGGIGFDGSGMGDSDELGGGASSDPWQDDSLTLSTYGYYGTAQVDVERDEDMYHTSDADRFFRIGLSALWRTGDLQLGGGYIYGKNHNPFGSVTPSNDSSVTSHSWFVEVNYFLKPWLVPYVRYEAIVFSKLPKAVTTDDEGSFPNGADRGRIVIGTKILIRANVSLGVEGVIYCKDEREIKDSDNNQLLASLRIAF